MDLHQKSYPPGQDRLDQLLSKRNRSYAFPVDGMPIWLVSILYDWLR